MSLELDADLTLSLGKMTKALNRNSKASLDAAKKFAPVFYRVVQNIQYPSSGVAVMRMGGPDQGHFWYVRQVTIGGLTPVTVAQGRCDIFVSAMDYRSIMTANPGGVSQLGMVGLQDWRDQATQLPLVGSYGRGELSLRFNEELYVIISNGSPGQIYVSAAQVEDFEEAADSQSWEV